MATFDLASRPLNVLTPVGTTPVPGATGDGASLPVVEKPHGVTATLGAAFENENTLVSTWRRLSNVTSNTAQEGYSPWDDIKGTPYEQHWSNFVDSNNAKYTELMKRQIDSEEENRRTLAASGVGGTLASMFAGIADPTVLIPIGGEVSLGAKGTWSVGKAAMTGARAGLIGATAQEAILQGTQETRPWEDSAMAVGSSVILGGLLGGGGAALLNRVEQKQAGDAARRLMGGSGGAPTSAGAMATPRATLDDLSISTAEGFGSTAEKIAGATQQLNPNLRANYRAVPAARQASQELAENTLYQSMHDQGRSLGPAVETLARSTYNGRMLESVRAHNTIFSEMKKSGLNLSRQDFEEAVGNAMRRGDEDPNNPYVSRAAKEWRERVFEPFKNEAIDLGLLPPDVSVATADSYFSRVYNKEMLTAKEGDFKSRVTNYYQGLIAADHVEAKDGLARRTARLDQEIADLRLDPQARQAALSELETKGDTLDAANPDQVERISRINELRAAQKAAKDAGNTVGETAAKDEIAKIQAEGGTGLKSYLDERRQLRTRRRRVDLNYAGLNERQDAIAQSLADLEERNVRSITRVVTAGQKLQREAQRLDPEKLREKISNLKTSFADVADRADKAADRTAKALEKMRADAETAALPKAEGGKGEGQTRAQLESEKAINTRLEKDIAAQRARAERMTSLAERLEAASKLDPEASLMEVHAAVDDLVRQVSDLTLSKGEKAARLLQRLEALDPKKLDERVKAVEAMKAKAVEDHNERWRSASVDLGQGEYHAAASDIADTVYDKLTGRAGVSNGSALPDYLTPITRGPLKDRTFNVPDDLIHDFLDSNVMSVAERYGRTMAGETELARKFGRADMRDQIQAIQDQYRDLRAAAGTDEKRLKFLTADEKGAIHDLEAMRDLIRGTYKAAENASNYGRMVRSLMAFNYIRSMGGAIIANWSEIYRPAMVHGLGRYMSQGIAPLMTNLKAIKLSVHEAQLAGQVTERVLQNRLMSLGEIGDPYRSGTQIERLLQNGAKTASKWNGLVYWTDAMKSISAVLSQNRILEGTLGKTEGGDARFLAYLGIDQTMGERIAEQFKAHGEILDNVHVANTEAWTDTDALRAYRAAISKDVDSIIITKSVGDVPLMANTPTGKMLMQFRNYAAASHSRLLLRGLQESKTNFVSGIIAMSTLGILGAYARSWRGGKDRFEKFQESAKNPGFLIGEGLDLSGIFALPVELGNTVEKLTQPSGFSFNPVKTPLLAAGKLANPSASMQGNSTRFAARDPLSAVLGPTAGLPMQVAKAAGAGVDIATGKDPNKAELNAATSLIPFGSYLGMREVISGLAGDSPYAPGE